MVRNGSGKRLTVFAGKGQLALDIGAGTGQATVALTEFYAKVKGVEPSKSMRESAVKHPQIEYADGTDEKIPAADGSVDLVTVAQACHWFNLPVFFKEVHRVLKPGLLVCSFALV